MAEELPAIRMASNFITPTIFILKVAPGSKWQRETVLLVNRDEQKHYFKDGPLEKAWITFHYQVIEPGGSGSSGPECREFSAAYHCGASGGNPQVCLTHTSVDSGGYCIIDIEELKSRGVGTYFMNLIIRWVQQWPDADVRPVELKSSDATPENLKRRNRFYEQFGICFDYSSASRKSGMARPMKAGELTPFSYERLQVHEKKVVMKPLDDHMNEQADESHRLQTNQSGLERQLKQTRDKLDKADKAPFLWAAATRWRKLWEGQ